MHNGPITSQSNKSCIWRHAFGKYMTRQKCVWHDDDDDDNDDDVLASKYDPKYNISTHAT